MAPTLGKRKRRDGLVDEVLEYSLPPEQTDMLQIQEVLKQHFEAKFKPLPIIEGVSDLLPDSQIASEDDSGISSWQGLSDSEEESTQLVQYTASNSTNPDVPRAEMKAFMTSRPPVPNSPSTSTARRKDSPPNEPGMAESEAANLKKDLALQRLLKESHLFEPQSPLAHTGLNRHKAVDLRLRDMGSKSSIYSQQNMPIAQRRGILAKAAGREEHRRLQAQENGIILGKVGRSKRRIEVKRQRGIGAPTVGKFSGGMLKLSKKDVAAIQGPKTKSRGRG